MCSPPISIMQSQRNIQSAIPLDTKLPFPIFLHNALDQIEREGNSHIIGWVENGLAFKVFDISLFAKVIMPRYFPHQSKIKSFYRQLGLYGFERIKGSYFHKDFVRGDKLSCASIRRSSKKAKPSTSARAVRLAQHDNAAATTSKGFGSLQKRDSFDNLLNDIYFTSSASLSTLTPAASSALPPSCVDLLNFFSQQSSEKETQLIKQIPKTESSCNFDSFALDFNLVDELENSSFLVPEPKSEVASSIVSV